MSAPVISAENLSKSYRLSQRANRAAQLSTLPTLRDVLGRRLRDGARKAADVVRGRQVVPGNVIEEFWALRDVNFEVQEGEVLGIIGHNGAGKSTLLKLLSRITEPTRGRITLRGRVASLLEVGTGFHPELTGRENIFLNGAILGMSRAEIRRKFDEIVAFAEVEHFLDTPVKRYSSGMYVRLAFAVAAHLEPEILVVDEMLAVGDAEFQQKCLGKMDEVSRREGRTVLVVSHNMGVITALCDKALWLDRGRTHEQGEPHLVVDHYLARAAAGQQQFISVAEDDRPAWLRDDRLRCTALEWLSPLPLRNGGPVHLRVHFETRSPVSGVSARVGFDDIEGARVLTYHMGDQDGIRRDFGCAGQSSLELEIDACVLGPGVYSINIAFLSGKVHTLDFLDRFTQMEVIVGPETLAEVAHMNAPSGVRLEGKWCWRAQATPYEVVAVAGNRR